MVTQNSVPLKKGCQAAKHFSIRFSLRSPRFHSAYTPRTHAEWNLTQSGKIYSNAQPLTSPQDKAQHLRSRNHFKDVAIPGQLNLGRWAFFGCWGLSRPRNLCFHHLLLLGNRTVCLIRRPNISKLEGTNTQLAFAL